MLLTSLSGQKRIDTKQTYQCSFPLSWNLLCCLWYKFSVYLQFLLPLFSRTKWYWTQMCFILEWKAGFLARCKALWLSQNKEMYSCPCSSSSNTFIELTFREVGLKSGLYWWTLLCMHYFAYAFCRTVIILKAYVIRITMKWFKHSEKQVRCWSNKRCLAFVFYVSGYWLVLMYLIRVS